MLSSFEDRLNLSGDYAFNSVRYYYVLYFVVSPLLSDTIIRAQEEQISPLPFQSQNLFVYLLTSHPPCTKCHLSFLL